MIIKGLYIKVYLFYLRLSSGGWGGDRIDMFVYVK